MRLTCERGRSRCLAWSCAALLAFAGASHAGDSEAELRALIERQGKLLEQQGKQIEELKRRLETINSTTPPVEAAKEEGAPALDPDAVRKIVSGFLKEEEQTKKKAEEEKKKQAEIDGSVVGSDLKMGVSWRHGMWAETADKAFRIHVGGRTQIDAVWLTAPDDVQFGRNGTGRINDGVNFRRARLEVDGTIYEVFEFFCEYDFANTFNAERTGDPLVANTPVATDLWGQIKHLPVIGNVRIGNQKPPLSFERLTSSRYLNFMERSFAVDAFVNGLDNGFRPGIQVFNWMENERATWAIGVFKNNTSVFGWNVGDGEYDITGRVTALPVYELEGRCLVHLGLGARHQDADEDRARFRARTLVRNGPGGLHTVLADLNLLSSGESLLVPEFVAVWGPFTLQSEYYANWVHDAVFPISPAAARINRGTAFFQGYYIEALYFLTGEHRRYDTHYPRFDRVIPNENFFFVKGDHGRLFGRGAWQVAARYSYLDLNDRGISGGILHDVTLGLNWFLNPNAKIQWNYSIAHRDVEGDTADGIVQGFGMRLAFDF
jgi:phosphate-selective porin OprO/OprP